MQKKDANNPWERDAVFVRLTKRRKAKLTAIAKDMAASATPSDAIERAIDLASLGGRSVEDLILDRLATLQDVVDQLFTEHREGSDRSEARMGDAIRNSKAVLDLLSAAAAKPEPDDWDGQ